MTVNMCMMPRGSHGVPKVYYYWYSSAEFMSTHVVQLFSKGVQTGVLWYNTYITWSFLSKHNSCSQKSCSFVVLCMQHSKVG